MITKNEELKQTNLFHSDFAITSFLKSDSPTLMLSFSITKILIIVMV